MKNNYAYNNFLIQAVNNISYQRLPSSKSKIKVSMWGQIDFGFSYDVINDSALIDGEVSNIDIGT